MAPRFGSSGYWGEPARLLDRNVPDRHRGRGKLGKFANACSHLLLPAFCLSYAYLAITTRIVRSSMISVLGLDFITTARANGIREAVVVLKHALKNAVIPAVTITGLSIGELLGGAILTETIFGRSTG